MKAAPSFCAFCGDVGSFCDAAPNERRNTEAMSRVYRARRSIPARIATIGYSKSAGAEIEFINGAVYRYAIPIALYRELMAADSKARSTIKISGANTARST